MLRRRRADRLGWAWVLGAALAGPWLGQGGSLCPPGGPADGTICLLAIFGPDLTLVALAGLGAAGLLHDRWWGLRRLSAVVLLLAGVLAGQWTATHQFLGTAWAVPRPLAIVLATLPPLVVAGERLTRPRHLRTETVASHGFSPPEPRAGAG